MKKTLITLLFLLPIRSSLGQTIQIDSLRQALTINGEDTNRVLLFQDLALKYAFYKPDSTFYYATRGIQLAKKINYTKGEALCLMRLAIYFRITGASAQGMQYAMNALPIFEKLNDNNSIILCNLLIGWTLGDQKNYRRALDYVLKVTPMAIQHKSNMIYYCYSSLSEDYLNLNLLDSALVYGFKANAVPLPDNYHLIVLGGTYLKMVTV